MYCGGTIFVDIASGMVHVYHQVFLAAADMLLSKAQFEHGARTHGIHIKKYHTDNGIFISEAWKEHLHGLQQSQKILGTGVHHQNAAAKRTIQTVHFVADQRFETVMGGLNPSLKFDLTDPKNIGTFLKTRWDTDDQDHALEHWDPEIDGEMPPLGPEWDTHPIHGQDLPMHPDLREPHPLPQRVRFQEPNKTQQRNEPAAPAAPPPIIFIPPAAPDPGPQCALTLTIDTDFPVDSPHPPSAPRGRPHFFDDDNGQPGSATEEPPPPILRSPQQGEQRSGRPKRVTKPPDRLTFEELGEPRIR
jgi:hypothetical protein